MQENTPKQNEPASVAKKLVGGAFINFMGLFFLRLMGLINIVILARLLTPEDFGILALALISVGFTEALINRQFEKAIIRQLDPDASHFDTAFTLSVLVGLSGAALIFFTAQPMARFFEVPKLVSVLHWMALVPLFMGLRNPYFTVYEKELDFKPAFYLGLVTRVLATVISVVIAIVTKSYWALVIAQISLHFAWALITWGYSKRTPRLGLLHWKAFVAFGGWLTLSGLAIFGQKRFPSAVLARLGTTFEAGLFQVANEISTTMTQQMLAPIGQALYPGLMQVSGDKERMKSLYLRGQQSILGVALPFGVGLAVAAPDVVRVLLGTQWVDAVPLIVIVTPVTALATLSLGVNAVKMIEGDTKTLFFRNLLIFVLIVPMTLLGYQSFGIVGLVIGQASVLLLNLILNLQIAARVVEGHWMDPLVYAYRSFIAVLIMAVVLQGLQVFLSYDPFEMPLAPVAGLLAFKMILALVICAFVHMVLWRFAKQPSGFERQVLNFLERAWGKVRQRS